MRYLFLDNLRGIAFIFMIIHHIFFFYDVSNDYKTSYENNIFIESSGMIARTLFILLTGISLSLNKNKDKKNKIKRIKRSIEIGIHALIISLITWIFFPNYFIRFGILHFISLGTLLAFYFIDKPILTFIFSLIFYFYKFPSINNKIIDTIVGSKIYYNMLDYFPLQPWFSLLLCGLFIGQKYNLDNISKKININILNSNNILTNIGKNALNLYTGHIIFLIIIYNIKNLLKK